MGEEADQLRNQIEQRRQRMGGTVDAIEDRVAPGRVVERQQARIGRRWQGLRESVMGTPDPDYGTRVGQSSTGGGSVDAAERARQRATDLADTAQSTAQDLKSSAQSTAQDLRSSADDVLSTVQDTPQIVRRKTGGNPLAAGAVAFGLGALVGTLSPASKIEREAVSRIEPQLGKTADSLRESATDVASTLQEKVTEKAEDLKSSAQSSAESVREEVQSATQEVKATAESEGLDLQREAETHRDQMTS